MTSFVLNSWVRIDGRCARVLEQNRQVAAQIVQSFGAGFGIPGSRRRGIGRTCHEVGSISRHARRGAGRGAKCRLTTMVVWADEAGRLNGGVWSWLVGELPWLP
jgi:hypothetical protein